MHQTDAEYLRAEYHRRMNERRALMDRHQRLEARASLLSKSLSSVLHDKIVFAERFAEYKSVSAERQQAWSEYRNAARREDAAFHRYVTFLRSGLYAEYGSVLRDRVYA